MKKSLVALAAALALLLTACGSPGESKPRPSASPAQAQPTDAIGSIANGVDADELVVKKNGDNLHAQFSIRDEKRIPLTVDEAQQDTIDILRAVASSDTEYKRVFVQGTFPVTDASGNTKKDMILNAGYDKATVDGMNFDGIKKRNVWDLKDSGTIHEDFRK